MSAESPLPDASVAPAAAARYGENSGVLSRLSRAFRHRNYRLFFAGQLVSLCGTFLSQVAIVWLVYRLTGKAWVLGLVAFCGQVPLFVLAPFAGVWVDRWDRRRLLVVTQAASMAQSFGVAAVAYGLGASAPHAAVIAIGALALCQGLINAFDMPARQAFLVQMVERREDLANAIALNSTMVHSARLIGPAAAGFLIQHIGEAMCFAIDGVSYAAVIASLLLMRVKPFVPPASKVGVFGQLREGANYVWQFTPIRALLLLMALLSLAGLPALTVLMPIFADALGGPGRGPQTLGLLMGASGFGALCGAMYLASRHSVLGLGRLISIAAFVFGGAIIAFSFSRHLALSLPTVSVIGLGMLINFASANTLLQTLVDDDKRGRVMSFFSMAFVGMTPFGNLIAGTLASRLGAGVVGASRTLLFCGGTCLAGAVVFAFVLPRLREVARPVYVSKGIIEEEVAAGIESGTEVVADTTR
jgi:MFS family permease